MFLHTSKDSGIPQQENFDDIREANIEVSEMFFIIYDKDGKKDINQYTISIEGKEQGWNTNKGN